MPFSPQTIEIRLNNLKGQNTMTDTKHTPGPWRLDIERNTRIRGAGKEIAVALVQTSEKFNVSQSEAMANARLIAAAPELLAALKALWFKVESICELQDTGLQIECLKARAAIAKAEGK